MTLRASLEAILFVASKPLTRKKLFTVLDVDAETLDAAIAELAAYYQGEERGIHLLVTDDKIQLMTNPEAESVVTQFTKSELLGDLTRAQLETLTVVAYRGPVSRAEVEQIRGVNCSVILRNLMMRGLVEEKKVPDSLFPMYHLSIDALAVLGISSVAELADYDTLHAHDYIEQLLAKNKKEEVENAETVVSEEGSVEEGYNQEDVE